MSYQTSIVQKQQLPQQVVPSNVQPQQTDQIDRLKSQNQNLLVKINQLTQLLADKEQEARQKDQTIQQLNCSLRWQADRIDHLSDQMSKAQSLLQKLNQYNKNHKNTEVGQYRTPRAKKGKLAWDVVGIGELPPIQKQQDQISKSKRSAKTEFLAQSRYKTQSNVNYSGYNQLIPLAFSSANIKKGPSMMDTPQLSRYRRQKLMASQNLGDVLKLHKFMTSKYG